MLPRWNGLRKSPPCVERSLYSGNVELSKIAPVKTDDLIYSFSVVTMRLTLGRLALRFANSCARSQISC